MLFAEKNMFTNLEYEQKRQLQLELGLTKLCQIKRTSAVLVRRVPLHPALRMLDFVLKQAKIIDVVQRIFRAITLLCMILF